MAVVNPTSVLHKSGALLKLGAEVLLLSETSAVSRVQAMVGAEMRKHDFKVFWGQPVPSHTREGSHKAILRGHAAGVAIMSRLPAFQSRPSLPDDLLATCRSVSVLFDLEALQSG